MEDTLKLKTVKEAAPYIRKQTTSFRIMLDVLISLIPVTIFAMSYFGWGAVLRIVVSIVIAILTELVIYGIMHKADNKQTSFWLKLKSRYKTYTKLNIVTPAVTGLILVLMLPPAINVYAVIVAAIVGIGLGKMVFGGTGKNIFNPAVVGRLFVGVAFTGMFASAYPQLDGLAGATALSSLGSSSFPYVLSRYSFLNQIIGTVPGSLGETSVIAILLGAGYLIYRDVADWRTMLGILVPFFVLSIFVGFALHPANPIQFALYQVVSGGIVYGAVFMATDPATSPFGWTGKLIFGLIISSVTLVIRALGAYPEGVAFSILFANMLVPLIDKPKWLKNTFNWKFATLYGGFFVVMILIAYFGTGGGF